MWDSFRVKVAGLWSPRPVIEESTPDSWSHCSSALSACAAGAAGHIRSIDIVEEARLWSTAILLVILGAVLYPGIRCAFSRFPNVIDFPRLHRLATRITDPQYRSPNPPRPRTYLCGPRGPWRWRERDMSRRTVVGLTGVFVYGWPSKRGVIVLDPASAVDMDFLGLDRITPPKQRKKAQDQEDAFCRLLLRLGATWWNDVSRYEFFKSAVERDPNAVVEVERGTRPAPSMRERRWVKVGWPAGGGLYVSEYDMDIPLLQSDEIVPSEEIARLQLVRDMDEKCRVLREHFNAQFFDRMEDYHGYGCLNTWFDDE